jgi:hypothetical protein
MSSKSVADVLAAFNSDFHFVSGERCPIPARKAYVDAVARLNKEGRSQAVVYMPGHVGYIAVPWYPNLETLIPQLGGKFIGGIVCEPIKD